MNFTGLVIKKFVRKTSSSIQVLFKRNLTKMNVIPIEALSDNYMYLIVDEATKECAAVDPVDPPKILERIKRDNLKLTKILTTHHHWDHANGNPELVKSLPDQKIPVYGGDDRIPALTNKVGHDETLQIGAKLNVRTLFTPCHTTGHICYYVTAENGERVVFTGDTLFIAGCGRFFEGTAEQMYHALIQVLSKLPTDTKVYCGHEYTVQNLKYSLHVEPNNPVTAEKLKWAEQLRKSNERTIPSTIGDEMKFNPFMRVDEESLKKRYGVTDPIKCMQQLRAEKDNWKPS